MNNTITTERFALSGVALAIAIVIGAAVFVVFLIAYTNVISRAGYSRWWILILLVPIANIVFVLIFCFKEWPIQRELNELRRRAGGFGQPGGYPQQY